MPRFLWTQKQDIGPKPRAGHAMAYDSSRGRVVLFGGDSLRSGLFNDTWEWDGENWTQMADIGPRPRRDCALVYDAARSRVLLFGGRAADGTTLGDTWEWNGEDWTQVADVGPVARAGHAMGFDRARNRAVLFGGESLTPALLSDTWEWDGQEWTQQEDTGPSPRKAHVMAYDNARSRMVLFGGDAGSGSGLGDTWEWDGAVWKEVAIFGPDPCLAAALVFMGDRVALFGGIDSTNASPPPRVFGNTWEWDGKHWTQRQDIGPGPRWSHAMAYDSTNNRIVLFGGLPIFAPSGDPTLPDRLLSDTWQHSESDGTPGPVVPGSLTVAEVRLSPPSLASRPGEQTTATVTLNNPAPAGGVTVLISVNSPVELLMPPAITIPALGSTGQFVIELGSIPPPPASYHVTAQIAGTPSETDALLTITPA